MDIDIWEVIDAAKTKPFGYMPFYPGPGLGGHCIPIDPFYLTWKAREFNRQTRFIELAGEINTNMPDYVIGKVVEALNRECKSVKGSRVLVLGLAYKPNVDDERESPSLALLDRLRLMGATVQFNDPHIDHLKHCERMPELVGLRSRPITDEYDLLLVATAHNEYREYDFRAYRCIMVDTRNAVGLRPAKYYKA